MDFGTLISVSDLAARLTDSEIIICDCRHDLADVEAGRRAYGQGHIPGARFLHLDKDLSGTKTGTNGRHPLPDPITVSRRLGAIGIDGTKQVIGYDASGGCYAARLWWTLRWLGHRRAAVLDGGWGAWLSARLPVSAEIPAVTVTTFIPAPRPQLAVDAAFVGAQLQNQSVCIIDARSPDRFRGENETLDPVGGHIPGALNRFFRNNLDAAGRFKPASELNAEFHALLGRRSAAEVVHQCGSGVTACHNLLAMEIAGLAGSRLYPGSWSEWVSDPTRPIVRSATAGPS
jgi:thiosulfate/3-mercaptopyruvate sulfurtransferase